MSNQRQSLEQALDYARRIGEWMGVMQYHGWTVDRDQMFHWECIIDGTYADELGLLDYEEQIAEAGYHARVCAFHTHDVAECDRHVAEYVMSQFDDEVVHAAH